MYVWPCGFSQAANYGSTVTAFPSYSWRNQIIGLFGHLGLQLNSDQVGETHQRNWIKKLSLHSQYFPSIQSHTESRISCMSACLLASNKSRVVSIIIVNSGRSYNVCHGTRVRIYISWKGIVNCPAVPFASNYCHFRSLTTDIQATWYLPELESEGLVLQLLWVRQLSSS